MNTRKINLPSGHVTLIDDDVWPLVEHLSMYVTTRGYVTLKVQYGGAFPARWTTGLHTFVMNTPRNKHTDHINGDKLDNRRCNLRITDAHGNNINRHRLNSNNRSGVMGVSWCGKILPQKPWKATITLHGENIYLGVYATLEEAAEVRRKAEIKYFGGEIPTTRARQAQRERAAA